MGIARDRVYSSPKERTHKLSETRVLCTGASGFIGTNLIDFLLEKNVEVLNVDKKPPKKQEHEKYWENCNILEYSKLEGIFKKFRPTHIVHLAARTDILGITLEDYSDNTIGTKNVLNAIKATDSISRVVITSTQFVHKPGHLPVSDIDFEPINIYGQSKVIAEQLTREAELKCIWTIIRPTNIWGAWHPRYPYEFWSILKKGLYFHPGRQKVIRCYGYVGNVVHQINKILEASPEVVNGKVFYVGDLPINLLDWTNGFSKAITGKNARVIPQWMVRIMAFGGDLLSKVGIKFPITTSRYLSMTTDYPTPMLPTIETFGEPPYSLDQGIQATVQWLIQEGYI